MKTDLQTALLTLMLTLTGAACYLLSKYSAADKLHQRYPRSSLRPLLVRKADSDTAWLCLPRPSNRLVLVKATPDALRDGTTGEVWIAMRKDSSSDRWVSTGPKHWKRRLSLLLADPSQSDTLQQWQEARQKLSRFVADEPDNTEKNSTWDADALLLHQLQSKVLSLQNRGQATYLLDRVLYNDLLETVLLREDDQFRPTASVSASQATSGWEGWAVGCWLLAGSIGVAGWWRKVQSSTDSQEGNLPSKAPEPEPISLNMPFPSVREDDQTTGDLAVETRIIRQYARSFYERYGSLFEDLQRQPFPPPSDVSQQTLQRLVEMALHAHTFAYFGTMNKLASLEQSPNARLLLKNIHADQLTPIRSFTTDAYKTDTKYRALFLIVKALAIQELDVLLEDQVFVPPDFLMNQKMG